MNKDDFWAQAVALAATMAAGSEPTDDVLEAVPSERTRAVFMVLLPVDIWQGLGIDPSTARVQGVLAEATGFATLKRKEGEPVVVPTKVELGTSSIWHRGANRTYMVAFVSVGKHRRQLPAIGAGQWDYNEQVVAELIYRGMTESTDLPTPDGTGAFDCTFCSPDGKSFNSHCPYCGGMARSLVPTPPYDVDLWSLYVDDLPEDAEPPITLDAEMAALAREAAAMGRHYDARDPKNSASYLGAVIAELARSVGWRELRFDGSTAVIVGSSLGAALHTVPAVGGAGCAGEDC